jgi:hypothetical protein
VDRLATIATRLRTAPRLPRLVRLTHYRRRIEIPTFTCPYCEQEMSATIGPNHTVIPDPTGRSHGVVVLSCVNGDCLKLLGAFPAPPQLAATSVPRR